MVARILPLLVVLMVIATNSSCLSADGAAEQGKAQQPSPADQITRKEFNELVQAVRDLTQNVAAMRNDTNYQLTQLRNDLNGLSDLQLEDRAQIDQLAKRDKNGRSYIRLDASHAPTRQELRRAIDATMPDYGTVWVENKMNSEQLIAINDVTYEVMANTSRPVTVALAPFVVQLRNQEPETRFFPTKSETATVTIQPKWPAPVVTHWINAAPVYYRYVIQ